MDANELIRRPSEVTRSTVQKAVVAIADSPQFFGQLREKLSMVTGAWFAQKYGSLCLCKSSANGIRDFTDVDILKVGVCSAGPLKGQALSGKRNFRRVCCSALMRTRMRGISTSVSMVG